jgi:hypothetical protein
MIPASDIGGGSGERPERKQVDVRDGGFVEGGGFT